jgi:hypothetical protein
MLRMLFGLVILLPALPTLAAAPAEKPAKTSKEALQAFNDLIGSWRGTGTPEGTREEKQKGFWVETISWTWNFKGDDATLKINFARGKHFSKGEIRYLPEKDAFQLTVQTPARESLVFSGQLKDRFLTLEREDEKAKETQRLVFTLLHSNRFLYRYEAKPAERDTFVRHYQVGAIKDGESFAAGDGKPECVVTGGLGTSTVTYKGQTYYVCCTGCRDAFLENPEKIIKEYQERKAREAKEKGR